MAYFLGRDVKVAITTEHDGTEDAGTSSDYGINSSIAAATSSLVIPNREVSSLFDSGEDANPVQDVMSIDLTIGAVDEDIAYMGQRTALKAEIKKENTITITKKKDGKFFDDLFKAARYGLMKQSGDVPTIHDGLTQPDNTYGYRVHVQLKASGEVISFPMCSFTEFAVTLNADGVQEEALTFMGHATPVIATSGNQAVCSTL